MRQRGRPNPIVLYAGWGARPGFLLGRRRTPFGAFALVIVMFVLSLALSLSGQAGAEGRSADGMPKPVDAMFSLDSGAGEPVTPPLQADQDDDHHHGWDWDGGWWIIMPVMMVVFWGGLIAAVVWGIRSVTGRDRHVRPLDVARGRLARGEISKDEFDRIRGDLE